MANDVRFERIAPVVTVLRIGGDVDAADQGPLDRLLRRVDGGWVHVDLSDLGQGRRRRRQYAGREQLLGRGRSRRSLCLGSPAQ